MAVDVMSYSNDLAGLKEFEANNYKNPFTGSSVELVEKPKDSDTLALYIENYAELMDQESDVEHKDALIQAEDAKVDDVAMPYKRVAVEHTVEDVSHDKDVIHMSLQQFVNTTLASFHKVYENTEQFTKPAMTEAVSYVHLIDDIVDKVAPEVSADKTIVPAYDSDHVVPKSQPVVEDTSDDYGVDF